MSSRPTTFKLFRQDYVAWSVSVMLLLLWLTWFGMFVWGPPKTEEDREFGLFMTGFFMLFTVPGLIWLGRRVWLMRRLVDHGIEVPGTVVSTGCNGEEIWHIVVRYEVAGRTYERWWVTGVEKPRGAGSPVTVLVDPARPKRLQVLDYGPSVDVTA